MNDDVIAVRSTRHGQRVGGRLVTCKPVERARELLGRQRQRERGLGDRQPVDAAQRQDETRRLVEGELLKEVELLQQLHRKVALGQVADFKVVEQVAAIAREYSQRRAAIMVNLRGRDVESFVRESLA